MVTEMAKALPVPYDALGDSPNLIDVERDDLAACEAAIHNLRIAYWAAGKALQVIRDARLYRADYPTFEEYCEQRWDMSRSYANRLIRAWPLTERLVPIGTKDPSEGQVRELLPLAAHHGEDAAVTVYQTVIETDGVQVTAAVLKGAVDALPEGDFDATEAVKHIRAYLAQLGTSENTAPETDAVESFTAETGRLRTILQRVVKRDILRGAARDHPEEVRQTLTELRTLLDEIERSAFQEHR
ncbi:hypothetical protein ABZ897_60000 [Nonomuraea sp. NPDC046802]|uniref:hypothetical protein n=1 Tax=Nonomuraea sp. NPDC046802 TaxID=3154919 RepID=UPI0033F64246